MTNPKNKAGAGRRSDQNAPAPVKGGKAARFASLVSSAVQAPGASELSRFDLASKVLASQPTGFHHASSEPAAAHPRSEAHHFEPTEDAQGRKVYYAEVDVDLIDSNPYNARRIYDPQVIKDYASSMLASGQIVPGLATPRDGRFICVAGHYRLKALRMAGIQTMKVMLHEELTNLELYELSYKENGERTAQTPLDNALVWDSLLKDKLYINESAIAEALNISLSNVNKTMSILGLPGTVLEIVREKPEAFALTALYELYQLSQLENVSLKVVEEMCVKLRDGEAGRKECAELRDKLKNPHKRKTKESSRQYKIHKEGREVGVLKDWDSGKVMFEIKLSDPTERAKLVAEMKERFKLED